MIIVGVSSSGSSGMKLGSASSKALRPAGQRGRREGGSARHRIRDGRRPWRRRGRRRSGRRRRALGRGVVLIVRVAAWFEQVLDLGDQRLRLERLGQEPVAADAGGPVLVERLEGAGEEQDRDVGQRRRLLDEVADLVAVLLRHDDVAEDEVRTHVLDLLDRQAPVPHRHDLEVLVRERQLDDFLDGDAVVRKQDLLAHRLKASKGSGRASEDRPLPPTCQSIIGIPTASERRSAAGGAIASARGRRRRKRAGRRPGARPPAGRLRRCPGSSAPRCPARG